MTINAFDKVNLKTLRSEIDAALKAVAVKNGIDLSIGNISFDRDGGRFTSRLTAMTKLGQVKIPTAVRAKFDGINVGDSFKHNTKVLTVTGFNLNKPKNCVTIADQNGKVFSCSLEMAKRALNK
jgi:hypothetical protein